VGQTIAIPHLKVTIRKVFLRHVFSSSFAGGTIALLTDKSLTPRYDPLQAGSLWMSGRSLDMLGREVGSEPRQTTRASMEEPTESRTVPVRSRRGGPPAYALVTAPSVPPVMGVRFGRGMPDWPPGEGHAHLHHFPVLAYFARGGGAMRFAGRVWRIEDGDVFVIAPGELVAVEESCGLEGLVGWGVVFLPEALGPQAPGSLLSWRTHPLLFPFARGPGGGASRLRVPPAGRTIWQARLDALDRELRDRRDGYQTAVVAHLTLLLVELARLAREAAGDFRLNDEPLLADVFTYIEDHYEKGISLQDVAQAVHLTPGYLTTLVRQKTGRPVQEWIAERRLAQARRLLVETDLGVAEIAPAAGYRDAAYFARQFKRAHGVTPLAWRRASRG
jgi:AraC family transcriptional activator of pobA